MTETEIAWVAGVLEGEACFDYNRLPKYPRIRVEMTDHDIIQRIHSLIGGKVSYPTKRGKSHWKPTAMLYLNGAQARSAMRAIRPWMGERRGAKIDSLLQAST